MWLAAGAVLWSCTPAHNYLDPEGPCFSGQYAGRGRSFNDTLKVVSFNIKFADSIRLAIEELAGFPELRDADIILLQEMDETGTAAIAQALACNYVYYPATWHPQNHKNFGNAILSRWPLRAPRKILLPYEVIGNRSRRIAVTATALIGDSPILVYSVHTATFVQGEEKKFRQAETILESVPQTNMPVIIGGDFNTLFGESWYAHAFLFRKNDYVLASSLHQPTAGKLFFRTVLDHIFVKGLQPLASGTVLASHASDHKPIWVKLEFPPISRTQN